MRSNLRFRPFVWPIAGLLALAWGCTAKVAPNTELDNTDPCAADAGVASPGDEEAALCTEPQRDGNDQADEVKQTDVTMQAVDSGDFATERADENAPASAPLETMGTPASSPPPIEQKSPISLRLTAIGDVNFNRNRVEVMPEGIDVWGEMVPFSSLTEGLDGWIDGDINFANIETVVTDRNDFNPPNPKKAFCFRSHPNGVKQLVDSGFNLFCLANNHAFDYGATGIRETLKHMQKIGAHAHIAYSGIGLNFDDASAPVVFEVKGVKIGFVAIGIGGPADSRAGASNPGVAHVSRYREALERLREADVDVRILSNHDGKEGVLFPIDRQLLVDRLAIRDYKVNIVLGHHPHRVQGVERYGDGIIFYSLGNGIMRGAADIAKRKFEGLHADFGLLAKVDFDFDPNTGKVLLKRVEAIPTYDMHRQPHPLPPEDAAARIATLNRISQYPYMEKDWNDTCPPATASTPVVFQVLDKRGVLEIR